MSALAQGTARTAGPATPRAPRRSTPATRPAIRVVPTPVAVLAGRAGAAGFVASCAGMLAVTLAGLLALNVAVSGNAFVLDEMSDDVDALVDQQESLGLRVAQEAAPGLLDSRARDLGMVPAESPTLLLVPWSGAAAATPVGSETAQTAPSGPPP